MTRRELVLYDTLETRMLQRAVAELSVAGVPVLLFKGAALARTLYDPSWSRPRSDADALIPPEAWSHADRVLVKAVGSRVQSAIDPRVMGQWQYRDRETGLLLDLHRQLFEPAPLAALLSFEQLFAAGIPVPGLEPARAPSLVHALWIALLHPIAHHDGASDPVWDEDLTRLAVRFTEDEWRGFVAHAEATNTCALCLHGMRRAQAAVPPWAMELLAVSGEPSAELLLGAPKSALARHLGHLRALPGWRARIRESQRRLFPPAEYMRARYGRSTIVALPWLYMHRIISGLAGPWRRRSPRPSDRFH